jgi:serine/threonine-protein kinase
MNAGRWAEIEPLYHAALAKVPEERASYLEAACGEDPALRKEVESLLAFADGSLESPAPRSELARIWDQAAAPDGRAVDAPPTAIGWYLIIGLIGEGGQAEVWKARDTRLDRIVANKRLKAEHNARFKEEARAIAALNHPNICALYDIGVDYLVMEYVEGAPVCGPMPVEQALKLAIQIAGALEEAHGKGILHRDLKPSNILVTVKGAAKLLDFGLAKLVSDSDTTQTMTGGLMGTPMYMAPEQAEGKAADRRSDVFSFGAVLYEMLAGRRAFDSLAAVVRDIPKPLEAPGEVAGIVTRCLAKSPVDRYQTMAELKAALERTSVQPARQQPSIAVLPFANMSRDPDDEFFSDGLAEEIMNTLAHLPGLKVTARTSAFAFRGKEQDIRKIAEALNVRTILEGSVRRSGSRIRVTAQLINADDGYHLWSERYDREMADVFAMQDEIAAAIARALEFKLVGKPATRSHLPDLRAYEAFLRGRNEIHKLTPDAVARAKEYFLDAIALDPEYENPYAAIGQCDFVLWVSGQRSAADVAPALLARARKALELSPADAQAHWALGVVAAFYNYDWKEAEEQFRLALAAEQVPPEVRHTTASFYLCGLGRFQEALRQVEKALEEDPLNVRFRGEYAIGLSHAEMHDRAIAAAQTAVEMDESHWYSYLALTQSYVLTGRLVEARAAAEKAAQLAPWNAAVQGFLTGILARLGDKNHADALLLKLGHTNPAGMFSYHLLCSEIDAAANWYARMIEQRTPLAVALAASPLLKPLRSNPRWPALAKMMNLP